MNFLPSCPSSLFLVHYLASSKHLLYSHRICWAEGLGLLWVCHYFSTEKKSQVYHQRNHNRKYRFTFQSISCDDLWQDHANHIQYFFVILATVTFCIGPSCPEMISKPAYLGYSGIPHWTDTIWNALTSPLCQKNYALEFWYTGMQGKDSRWFGVGNMDMASYLK